MWELVASIQKVTDSDSWIDEFNTQKFNIQYYANQLDPLLQGELEVQNAYLVMPKRAYDIDMLIWDATKIFSEDARRDLSPIERYDIQQAGKCLAFEVATAALFHMFRAADSVLRRYHKMVLGSDPAPKMRNWGVFIRGLKNCGSDAKIVSALDQIKDLHRNPVIHPEAQVSIEEALSFIGIAESVISAMLADIRVRLIAAQDPVLPGFDGLEAPRLPVSPGEGSGG